MKNKRLTFALILPVIIFSMWYSATAQDSTAMSYEEKARVDSLEDANDYQKITQDQEKRDSQNLLDLKAEKRYTKAKAKEAQRVENDANDAARESRTAYRKEKKAQKARKQADKQSKKAAKARSISDQN